jgi:hypothetical protein
MATPKKRPRGDDDTNPQPVSPCPGRVDRHRLLRRVDETPAFWNDIAARFGVIGADACLCALGREVAGVIRAVGESADAERQRLKSLRTSLHVTVDERIDALLSNITTSESAKIAALERELERLDAVIERVRREHEVAREALISATDDEDAVLSTALKFTASLDDIDALLATLPHAPVELSLLRLDFDESALLSTIRTAGAIIAPRGVHAADVVVRGLPMTVRSGRPLRFELALSDDYPCRAPAELEAAAASLAFRVHVSMSLDTTGSADKVTLRATPVGVADGGGIVVVSVEVPALCRRDASVAIDSVTLAGQAVTGGFALPVRFRLASGMHAPLALKGAAIPSFCTPVISSEGTLYVPRGSPPGVLAFSADGASLPPLPLVDVGLLGNSVSVAYVDESDTLLLGGVNGSSSTLVAVDAASKLVRWVAKLANSCFSIAVLPASGIVISSNPVTSELHVHRLSDGIHVARATAYDAMFVATDRTSKTVFVSTGNRPSCRVSAFRWNGVALSAQGALEDVQKAVDHRPLAVMPPDPGRRSSYLVVATLGRPTLLVLSLPDRRLIHTHTLESIQVSGLAADPSGAALTVCDSASECVRVLLWPLPGMLPLL